MKEKVNFWNKLVRTTKIAGYNPETFKEKWSFKLNRIQMLSLFLLITFLISGLLIVLLIFTPLGYLMPEGYSNPNKIKYEKALQETKKIQDEIAIRDQYIDNLKNVLLGNISIDSVYLTKPEEISLENEDLDTTRSINELNLAADINESLKDEGISSHSSIDLNDLLFLDPVKGVISQGYSKNHPGVDISLSEGSNVKACLDGVVISSFYSDKDGNTLIISHEDGFLSIYKHNKELIKKSGDQVNKGDVIALSGNTGEHTTGPHLHFEIWQNNKTINPLNIMSFK